MGRKKKVTKIEEPKIEKKSINTISYKGTVKVSVQKNNKTISSKTFHNTGNINLFKFLCKCLAGTYNDTERPCRIALFSGNESEKPETDSLENLFTYNFLSSLLIIQSNVTFPKNESNSVVFHFRLPYAFISSNTIYKMALFSNRKTSFVTTDRVSDYIYAYYLFYDGDNKKWVPLNIDQDQVGNYSLIVDWTMTIDNQALSKTEN